MIFSEVAQQLAQIGRDFHRRGWVLGTSGNFSAVLEREPLRVAITESAADKGNLKAGQILEIDGDASVLKPKGPRPSAETLVHLAVLRRTDAASVLHTHSVWSTLLSDWASSAGGFAIEGYEMLKGLAGVNTHEHREWLPVLENTQDMTALSCQVETLLAERPLTHAFLIERHGLYTWGRSLDEAVRHVEILEFLMEVLWRSFEFQNTNKRSASNER
jgi:methylthioribulose-1-phosphate dehydratase